MIAAPMPLGPFLVNADGRMDLKQGAEGSNFSFVWRGHRFLVRLAAPEMRLSTIIGRIPSTASGAQARSAAFAFAAAAAGGLPPGAALKLLPDHRIQLDVQQNVDWPNSIGQLLAPVIGSLLRAAPVLDLAQEAGLA